MEIRKLTINDLNAFKMIRLELLENNPTYFGSSHIEEASFAESMWISRLSKPHVATFGVFDKNELIGITTTVMNPRAKIKHVATLNSMYIKVAYQGQGLGAKLIQEVIAYLKNNHVELLNLSVVSTNLNAITLYQKLGFTEYGKEANGIKYNNQYYDLLLMTKIL